MKIEKLTPEQESELPAFREYWRSVGLNTDPCDREKAIASVKALYAAAGLSEPRVLFFNSPLLCLWARGVLMNMGEKGLEGPQLYAQLDNQLYTQLRAQLDTQLYTQLYNQLRDQLRAQLRTQLRAQLDTQLYAQLDTQLDTQLYTQLYTQLRDQLGTQLYTQLHAQLYTQLCAQLDTQLYTQLYNQLYTQLRAQLDTQLYAQLDTQLYTQLGTSNLYESMVTIGGIDSYWLAFYEFGRNIGVKYTSTKHLDAYLNYAQTAGIMFAYDGIALVSDRPEILRFDNERRLHCENGPAIKFRDGWAVHSWHGQLIPSEWIEVPGHLTPEMALTWENIEQRTAACEILGWHKIIDANSDYKLIDKDDDPERGALVSINLPDHGNQKFLRVKCGTGRDFALMVPDRNDEGKEIKTVFSAQAALAGLPEQLFNYPTERT